MQFPGITVGLKETFEHVVGHAETAAVYDASNIEKLLSTPGVVAMMMGASQRLLDHRLPEGFVSVGKRADVQHEQPSVEGAHVRITVEVTAFDGYHVEVAMSAEDDTGLIATGYHVRTIVNQRWFEIKVQKRASQALDRLVMSR